MRRLCGFRAGAVGRRRIALHGAAVRQLRRRSAQSCQLDADAEARPGHQRAVDRLQTHARSRSAVSTLFVSVCLHRRNTDIRAKRITLYKMLDSYLLSVTIERFNSAFAQIRIDCPTG